MLSQQNRTIIYIILAVLLLIALCVIGVVVGRVLLKQTPLVPATQNPNLIYTAAAQTVSVQLTQGAIGTPIVVPSQTPGGVVQPTATQQGAQPTYTPLPTYTQYPTATHIPPTATPIPIPCDRVSFVKDVTYPDNTEVAEGSVFVKTWRLENNGSCTWTSSYSLVFVDGDSMGGPATSQLTTGTVAPGGTIDVSVSLRAPGTPDTYRGNWMLRNPSGVNFGLGDAANKPFWVQIKSVSPTTPTPTPTSTPIAQVAFDFISSGPDAAWSNAQGQLPWGDPGSDSAGIATEVKNKKMEDGKTYARLLATYPQIVDDGYIQGIYPLYTVVSGDHFRTLIGLREGCQDGKVRFQLKYREGVTDVLLGEWVETCDGKLTTIDINLSALQGHAVQFILIVRTEGSPAHDKALWVAPRIER